MTDQDCRQDDGDEAARRSVPIVAIGASAGGIPALQNLLGGLPSDLGAAFVVVIHLDPSHKSELANVLAATSRFPVVQVNRSMILDRNTVYVIAPNSNIVIADSEIRSEPIEPSRGQRYPIDLLFMSLAQQESDAYAVVLTGNGSDGSLGAQAVRMAGGLVLVQDPSEAEYPSMPESAIAMGVDFILPIDRIASKLVELLHSKVQAEVQALDAKQDESLKQIFNLIRAKTGQDFSKYKHATVMRRLLRRMHLASVSDLSNYLDYLRRNDAEVQKLFGDLLISVTCFFRDPAAFAVLQSEVLPKLLERETFAPIRVWIPGCATGEEAYSIAILLIEEAERRRERVQIQIFASDADAKALAAAREGVYPASIISEVGEERVKRFFVSEGDHFRIRQDVRDLIVFAPHNLLRDPPFSHCDLISCRNVLIYLQRELQEQAISTFSYALRDGGYLFLGTSETADNPSGLFSLVDNGARIYQATSSSRIKRAPISHDLLSTIMPPITAQRSGRMRGQLRV